MKGTAFGPTKRVSQSRTRVASPTLIRATPNRTAREGRGARGGLSDEASLFGSRRTDIQMSFSQGRNGWGGRSEAWEARRREPAVIVSSRLWHYFGVPFSIL